MRAILTAWVLTSLAVALAAQGDATLDVRAGELKRELVDQVIPYWLQTSVDRERGGFVLADDGRGNRNGTEKQLVSQARMVWGFSHAHIHGVDKTGKDCLAAAKQGYEFLLKHFRDEQDGGYFWTTDLQGAPKNRNKIVYGQSFVIYGLVEYYRASNDPQALQHAMKLFQELQSRSYDPRRKGWIEHFEADWTPILKPDPGAIVEVGGFKSANTHLHLMEAFAELYDVTRNPQVKKAVEEALMLNKKYFYPKRAGESCFHRQLDWKPVTLASSAGLSYGHNVEFAWLMIRAEQVLGRQPSWDHFYAHLDHALSYGYDHKRGGLYSRGVGNEPASDTDKIWWVQSEMLAALSDALTHRSNPKYEKALVSLIDFISKHQSDPKTRIWMDTVTADGTPKVPSLAHSWKANYHDVRALVKFIEAQLSHPR